MNGRPWTNHEVKYLQQHYGFIPVTQIAKDIGRTEHAVRAFVSRRTGMRSGMPHKQSKNVKEIKQWIYDGWHPTQIAEQLSTTTKAVYNRVRNGKQYDDVDYSALKANARRHGRTVSPIR